jgi:Fic family protein
VGRYISIERLIEESKETYYEALRMSSEGWHEGRHRLKPWWEYFLGILIRAYRQFEERLGTITRARGAKTTLIEQAIERLPLTFSISDLERACPSISRDMIRVVLNRLRKEGRLLCKGTGRNALWEKRGNNRTKGGNKRGNVS